MIQSLLWVLYYQQGKERKMEKFLSVLGHEAKDVVSGYKGIADGVNFELFGCVQVSVRPKVDKNNVIPEGRWFDFSRLEIVSKKTVMPVPDFNDLAHPKKATPTNTPGGTDLSQVKPMRRS